MSINHNPTNFYAWLQNLNRESEGVAFDEYCGSTRSCRAKNGPTHCRYHGNPHYYTLQMTALDNASAERFLGECHTTTLSFGDFTRTKLYKKIGSEQLCKVVESGVKGVSKEQHILTCRAVATVMKDLQARFGCRVPLDFLVPASLEDVEIEGSEIGGATELDHLWGHKATLLFSLNPSLRGRGYCYGHDDERFPFDVIRHEIGHILTTMPILREYQDILGDMAKEHGPENVADVMEKYTSKMARDSHPIEGIAEIFARVTAPDYEWGTLPPFLEQMVHLMMSPEEGE